jgi:hypothetical protein
MIASARDVTQRTPCEKIPFGEGKTRGQVRKSLWKTWRGIFETIPSLNARENINST